MAAQRRSLVVLLVVCGVAGCAALAPGFSPGIVRLTLRGGMEEVSTEEPPDDGLLTLTEEELENAREAIPPPVERLQCVKLNEKVKDQAKRKELFNSVPRTNHKETWAQWKSEKMPKKIRGPIWRQIRDFACGSVVGVSSPFPYPRLSHSFMGMRLVCVQHRAPPHLAVSRHAHPSHTCHL